MLQHNQIPGLVLLCQQMLHTYFHKFNFLSPCIAELTHIADQEEAPKIKMWYLDYS